MKAITVKDWSDYFQTLPEYGIVEIIDKNGCWKRLQPEEIRIIVLAVPLNSQVQERG